MIKFAVMTFMYNAWANSEKGSHEKLIQILTESGADGAEALCNTFMGNNKLLKLYQKELNSNKLEIPVMDLIVNLACSDKKERVNAYEKMRIGIEICDALGSEVVHVAGSILNEKVCPEEGRKWIAEGLAEFVGDVEKRGMTLAFEDYDLAPDLVCSAADCLDILRQSDPRVKFVFDTGNFEVAGEHAEDCFESLIKHTCHFHFKDFTSDDSLQKYHGTYFSKGIVKNRAVAEAISKINYNGWVALESYLQDNNGLRETVPKELSVLKSMF